MEIVCHVCRSMRAGFSSAFVDFHDPASAMNHLLTSSYIMLQVSASVHLVTVSYDLWIQISTEVMLIAIKYTQVCQIRQDF